MLINFTNHPYAIWPEAQREAARAFGEVKDLPFPQVAPHLSAAELRALADEYAEKIEAMKPDAVLAAGEFTLLFMLVDRLLQDGITVVSSCYTRETIEYKRPDGTNEKKAVFRFECFRRYEYFDDRRITARP